MKILHEFVPSRNYMKLAEETKDLVDGWNITDSAAGIPAPSGTAVGCVLKTKYSEKIVVPIFILQYKSPVEAGGLGLAAAATGLDGIVVDGPAYHFKPFSDRLEPLWGDRPKYGEPLAMFKSPEEGRDFLRETLGIKDLKIGGLITAKRPVEDCITKAKDKWDFVFFMRLEEDTMPKLKQISEVCKGLNKPIYTYFLVGTPKNEQIIKMIGWPITTTIDRVEEFASMLEGIVDGIIATCAGDYEGDMKMLEKLQKFRG